MIAWKVCIPNGIKSQSGKAALEEMVGAGENFGNLEEIFGGKDETF